MATRSTQVTLRGLNTGERMSATASQPLPTPVRAALWSSIPIAMGAVAASLAGLLSPSTYAAETPNWAAQGAGQDAANLVIYPTLLVLAWLASRGSLRAYLAWLGVLAYTAYSYLVYSGYLHFSGWFLVYVAVFGLSTHALVVGWVVLDPIRLRTVVARSTRARAVGWVLTVLGALFAALWLSEIVPAVLAGATPEPITEAGLITNPIWVLDLGLVLPAMIAAGWLVRRSRPLGFTLAGPLLGFGVVMGLAILGMQAMLWVREEPVTAAPVVLMATLVVVEATAFLWLSAALPRDASIPTVLRPGTSDHDEARRLQPVAAGVSRPGG